jgi:hypothetical protein
MTGIVVLAATSDPRPEDNNVVAGWVGAVVLVALVIAVVFILRSFTRQLKKVDAARDAGVYDEDHRESDSPPDETPDAPSDTPGDTPGDTSGDTSGGPSDPRSTRHQQG